MNVKLICTVAIQILQTASTPLAVTYVIANLVLKTVSIARMRVYICKGNLSLADLLQGIKGPLATL